MRSRLFATLTRFKIDDENGFESGDSENAPFQCAQVRKRRFKNVVVRGRVKPGDFRKRKRH